MMKIIQTSAYNFQNNYAMGHLLKLEAFQTIPRFLIWDTIRMEKHPAYRTWDTTRMERHPAYPSYQKFQTEKRKRRQKSQK